MALLGLAHLWRSSHKNKHHDIHHHIHHLSTHVAASMRATDMLIKVMPKWRSHDLPFLIWDAENPGFVDRLSPLDVWFPIVLLNWLGLQQMHPNAVWMSRCMTLVLLNWQAGRLGLKDLLNTLCAWALNIAIGCN